MLRHEPANENARTDLIAGSRAGRGGMSTETTPKSVADQVSSIGTVAHVVEVRDLMALVHASPTALAHIIGTLKHTVSPAKRGGDYYVVRLAKAEETAAAPSAPQARPSARLSVAPAPADAAPAQPAMGSETRMNIGGSSYTVRETPTKRSQDVRRWEVRKIGTVDAPYVVTFQAHDGSRTACSCKGGIYHKNCKHMDAFRVAFGRKSAVA